MAASQKIDGLLKQIGGIAVAVSGGVDSMTLMSLSHRLLGGNVVQAVHAVSPAVPPEATARVRFHAANEGWQLQTIEAGEFIDPQYISNPVNRCFFCKTNLYDAIQHVTGRQIVSGANLDDLGEYRPGLDAAREHKVRHPFVEAAMNKAAVRTLARELGLETIAELPASPCLSSRIETGLPIEPTTLQFINRVEDILGARLGASHSNRTVRCRVRASGIVIELDANSLGSLGEDQIAFLRARIVAELPLYLNAGQVTFAPYRNGSAFLTTSVGGGAA